MSSNNKKWKIGFAIFFSLLLIVAGLSVIISIPYFVIQAGSANEIGPLVKVQGTTHHEKGKFFLTTVSIRQGKEIDYLLTKLFNDVELVPENHILAPNQSQEDYDREQAENMLASKNDAIISAFTLAGKPLTVKKEGIEVFDLVKNQPNGLQTGDLIQGVDQTSTLTPDELIKYLSTKKAGDHVIVHLVRNNQAHDQPITLIQLPVQPGEKPRAGLGIVPMTHIQVISDPPVQIHTEDIGGPSAGLMFSLEVYNQLVPEDLTRGYLIAGTGTIDDQGNVGQIGGIQHKIVAANDVGAQIFFCPKDLQPGDDNEKTVKAKVKELGLHIKIVPVATLKEAVDYLEKLHPLTSMNSFQVKSLDSYRVSVI